MANIPKQNLLEIHKFVTYLKKKKLYTQYLYTLHHRKITPEYWKDRFLKTLRRQDAKQFDFLWDAFDWTEKGKNACNMWNGVYSELVCRT